MKSYFSSVQGSVIIGAIIISLAILISNGTIKLKGLNTTKQNVAGTQASPLPSTEPEESTIAQVSLDDDPVLGEKDAKVTVVEFSDYECPFCKRHFTQVYPQLKKEYIDTGKIKLVFRDLPLSFHDPMATTEAIAANCAREQGGDEAYFKMHDEMFAKTTSNGTGLTVEQLPVLAQNVGLSGEALKKCVDEKKYESEVQKDLADAESYGANGTPTFFIGKSSDTGTISGKKIVGAQPFSAFKTEIDQLLAE